MRGLQIISIFSIAYFIAQCIIATTDEAKMIALMGILLMILVLLVSSHLYGKRNDIADEIRENHKRSIASDNGANIVQSTPNQTNTKATK
jgi:ABC-type transport system involved in cytochrome bd biosynthesis fused ATPase/permease subunit